MNFPMCRAPRRYGEEDVILVNAVFFERLIHLEGINTMR